MGLEEKLEKQQRVQTQHAADGIIRVVMILTVEQPGSTLPSSDGKTTLGTDR